MDFRLTAARFPAMAAAAVASVDIYEDEEEQEDIVPEGEIQERLGITLNDIDHAGLFAFHKKLDNVPNPGISIEGAGAVSFPLGAADLAIITAASTPVSDVNGVYGREVPAEKLRIGNPSWERTLSDILDNVVEQLGVDACVKGLDTVGPSLILYQPGNLVQPCSA